MNKGLEREATTLAISNRLSQISFKNKLIDADLNYKNRITNKIKKINESSKKELFPKIYAKAEEINKKLSLLQHQSNSFYGSNYIASTLIQPVQTDASLSSGSSSNLTDTNTQSMFFESTSNNGNSNSRWLKSYDKTRRRSMIVSKFLDGATKLRLEQMKTFGNRRLSIQSDPKAKDSTPNDLDEQAENDADNVHKISKSENSIYPILKTRNPRFGATLSIDAQFAIMKSLEDTIVREIEKNYPDMKNRVPRTTTAQYMRRKTAENNINVTESNMDFSASNQTTTNEFFSTSLNNLKYDSEIFNEPLNQDPFRTPVPPRTAQNSQADSDLAKKLVVTQQIESAMEILDNLRINKKKSNRKEVTKASANINRIHFDSNINYSNINPRAFATPSSKTPMKSINKRTNLTTPVALSRLRQENNNSTLAKLETIDKYSEWKSGWMHLIN
jgi:hypothetical protein